MVSEKKETKSSSMLEAAHELFTSKGVNETSIDDIVKKAKVAKGTFYLYFKDKYDLVDRIASKKSTAVILEALNELDRACQQNPMPFTDRIIFFVDYIIEYLQDNKQLFRILYKNLSKGLFATEEAKAAASRFCDGYVAEGGDPATAKQMLFLLVEMVGATCYSAIAEERPYTMDEIRPALYTALKQIVS